MWVRFWSRLILFLADNKFAFNDEKWIQCDNEFIQTADAAEKVHGNELSELSEFLQWKQRKEKFDGALCLPVFAFVFHCHNVLSCQGGMRGKKVELSRLFINSLFSSSHMLCSSTSQLSFLKQSAKY